jgi:hypothetical protein
MVQTSLPTKKSPSIMDGQKMMNPFALKSIKQVGMNAYPPITNWVCMGLHAANFNVD